IQEGDRRKDEFLAMLAHELRNPLAPIRNAVQVLRLIGLKEPPVLQARDMIDRQVTHMARLIDDLLAMSRLSRGKGLLRKERVDLAQATDGREAVIAIRDTGIGMEPEVLARVFEAFSQADRSLDRSRGGLGLGLALVKGLIELHGGHVQVTSDGPGKGTELVI